MVAKSDSKDGISEYWRSRGETATVTRSASGRGASLDTMAEAYFAGPGV
jgi:hypothetical protein